METDEGFEYRRPGYDEQGSGIPQDAWAFRLTQWSTPSGELLTGLWHRTADWFRRQDGLHSGLRSVCGRVYNCGVEVVGAPDMHPIGYLCFECFGIYHSDQLTKEAR